MSNEFGNPVHQQSDGTYWFWDETWSINYGPYKDRESAEIGCKQYAAWLNGDGRFMPPNEFIDNLTL